jgi:2',3'-cyclic-nucleotide 2'-phosphodiesterase (5'-nucleotidase family)
LEYTRSLGLQADFCVLNNGGLRASLPQGEILIRNIFELMPFDNEVVIVTMTGDQVKPVFQYIADKKGVPMSGIRLKIGMGDNSICSYGEVTVGGEKFDETKTYRLVTSDYLAGGGDSMGFFSKGVINTTSVKIRDAIIGYIRLQTGQHKTLDPRLDGRLGNLQK